MTAAEAVTLFVAGSTCQRGGRRGGAKDAKGSERSEAPEVSGTAPVHRDFGCAALERAVPPRPSRRLGGFGVAGFVDAEGAEEAQRTRRGPSGSRRRRFGDGSGERTALPCPSGARQLPASGMAGARRWRFFAGAVIC